MPPLDDVSAAIRSSSGPDSRAGGVATARGESVWAAPSDYYNRTYSGAFRYAYRARSVDMEFGLDYYRDDVAGRDAANYFIPYAHLRFDLGGGGFVPYVELDGTLKHNDMREFMETNLYYVPRYTDPMPRNTVDYSVRVGVSGRLVEDRRFTDCSSAILSSRIITFGIAIRRLPGMRGSVWYRDG